MNSNELIQMSRDYARIEQAISFLEQNFRDQPDLAKVAESVNLSPYHFQRLFKRWAGITPKQFSQFLTIEYAKQMLAESHSILDTSLEAGLSGPSRLHDLFVTFEAMTPGEFKSKGEGLEISYGFHPTPFGRCLLATTDRGICHLSFVEDDRQSLQQLMTDWPNSTFTEDQQRTQPLADQIFSLAKDKKGKPVHILLKGTNFQVKVWEALLKIPEGSVVSYDDVAALIEQPSATRAVAGAVAKNPVAYLIPCHRVIRKMGAIHNYRWGASRKKAMIGWEASRAARMSGENWQSSHIQN